MIPIKSKQSNISLYPIKTPEEELKDAITLNQIGKIKKLIKQKKILIGQKKFENSLGEALVNSYKFKDKKICKYLINQGVSLETPILYAMKEKNLDQLKYFVNSKNIIIEEQHMIDAVRWGTPEILEFLKTKGGKLFNSLLHESIRYTNFSTCKFLLDQGIPSNFSENGLKPIAVASLVTRRRFVELFIDKGEPVDSFCSYHNDKMEDEKWTPLMFAARAGNFEVIPYLLEKKANVNARSKNLLTPLHGACFSGDLESIKYLVKNGADINAADYKKWTPITFSVTQGDPEVVDYLRKKGANMNIKTDDMSLRDLAEKGMLGDDFDKRSFEEIIRIIDQKKCVICSETAGIKACSGCMKVYYCGREHQVEDWKNSHKNTCKN